MILEKSLVSESCGILHDKVFYVRGYKQIIWLLREKIFSHSLLATIAVKMDPLRAKVL